MPENLNLQNLLNDYALPWGINIVMALAIFIIGRWVVRMLVSLISRLMRKTGVDPILVGFVTSIANAILLLFVIIASLDQLGVDTTSFIALIGAAGLAVGLALQGSLQNFAAGVLLIIFRPFKVGDGIEAAGTIGEVEEIGIFSTRMKTGDNREIIVPNGAIYGGNITNNSARPTRRIDMVFGISYDDDLRKAKEIIQSVIDADERILKEPAPLVAVGELAESSVNFNVRPWAATPDYWAVRFDLNEKIKLAFDDAGITIPYPQMDVHTHSK
ncbi:MAG: mechanosensitive ion channel protein MscS [Zetaproteobacteria bacterium CG06_land_8_20_14_3_00_59_53]|nr:MAG: mechanosensitive ion channel protein MscS [Zetaproteobacteria bacterium CG2_30_59_37]PIO89698.1 MAG: mechanosensitive ion channel protein MscS [Zetaproteobacteria bacterium CG23_combo_of_CG06-09_8_20_14_all_59_86]PIQ65776.1 MAG: mechanosensitive ion channel protein MscS [Zetaproteobacteria bacterium CG11_big_fil_rev_8_21_14_0_20_59_439]PIU70109.1 MAG: mechanosensitive ion channel protein MscS [Zetaproteobacteria bacterium CG06_land_8_20_14_3_00_59_53]PIU96563.1 MAG: mechanosensitive ion